jgi:hypothetical protein
VRTRGGDRRCWALLEELGVVGGNYEIRVVGRLSDALVTELEGLSVTTEPVETVIYGPVSDPDALHRLLVKLQSVGLEVVEFHRLPAEPTKSGEPPASAD